MANTPYDALLAALMDSWDRNNTILVNLVRAMPVVALEIRPTPTSPTIGGLFMHMHYCRLIFVEEVVPECATPVPTGEWRSECGFRLMSITHFGRSRSPASLEADHSFRSKPITRFG